jgi:integrase
MTYRSPSCDTSSSYIARRRRDDAALAIIQYELAILRRGFTLAVRRQLLPFRPAFPTLRIDNARQGFFERDGLERVRAALPEALRNVMTFAYLTGWRVPSEVLPLTWDRVDFAVGVVRLDVRTTKNGAGRTFPFDVLPELAELLRRQRLYTDLFEATNGQPIARVFPSGRSADPRLLPCLAESLRGHRAPRPDFPRFPPHGSAQPSEGRRTGVLGDAAHRA